MSVPRRNGKGLREGSKAATPVGQSMHQGVGWKGDRKGGGEGADMMAQRMHQGGKSVYTGPKDVAQRMHQGSIKE